jgi:hypothetical protein
MVTIYFYFHDKESCNYTPFQDKSRHSVGQTEENTIASTYISDNRAEDRTGNIKITSSALLQQQMHYVEGKQQHVLLHSQMGIQYWVFGHCPSSGILETRKHSVSETGSVSVLRWEEKTPTLLGSLKLTSITGLWLRFVLSKGANRVGVFPPHLRTETDPVSKTLCFLVSEIQDDGQSPKTQ